MKILKSLWTDKSLISQLAKNDFRNKYITSYLGVLWGFIPSIATVVIYWFVFNIGFRIQPVGDIPYLLWLMCGLVPWFYFSDAVIGGINSYVEYAYLVKKMVFKIQILPIVKSVSSLYVHLFFMAIMLGLFIVYGYLPDFYYLQLFYYMFALICLVTSISFLLSTLLLFFRDLNQIVMVLLQMLVWMTPILWDNTIFPINIVNWLKFNPMFYIVQGYKDSLINKIWFWAHPVNTLYFWFLILVISLLGISLFKKLKQHFADLL